MIAYYAHSHGNGHFNTAQLFTQKICSNTIILTAAHKSGANIVKINDEDTAPVEYKDAIVNLPAYAHYLPKSNRKIVCRTKQIIDAIVKYNITVACIDVSVETAIVFRIASIPYGYNVLVGNRNDTAHQIAFEAADFLYSFLPEIFFKSQKEELKSKTFYLGFHSRFAFRENSVVTSENDLKNKRILVICGKGGTLINNRLISKISNALPDCHLHIAGSFDNISSENEKLCLGYVNDIEYIISESDVVISSCGLNLTSEILAIKNKFLAIAEERPYDEQKIMQETLVKHQLAIAFDEDNLERCIRDVLELQPSHLLEDWFCDTKSTKKFKQKIKSYEE
jgi:UDP-N-acetylglucosamine:LPS N-acetylglucosamine transferase